MVIPNQTDKDKAINELKLALHLVIKIAEKKELLPREREKLNQVKEVLKKHSSVTNVLR